MKALDTSRYTGAYSADEVRGWMDTGIGLVIIQAHPAGYRQDIALAQAQACTDAGMPWVWYVYQYMADPDWTLGAIATMALAASMGLLPHPVNPSHPAVWLDVEDVETERGWPAAWRQDAVNRDLEACNQWAFAHGFAQTGIYTGAWYWVYMQTAQWNLLALWDSNYNGRQELTPVSYGGWGVPLVHQYAGTSAFQGRGGFDLDYLDDTQEEEIDMARIPADVVDKFHLANDQDIQGLIDNYEGIITTVRAQDAQGVTDAQAVAAAEQDRINALVAERDAALARAGKLDAEADQLRAELAAEGDAPAKLQRIKEIVGY